MADESRSAPDDEDDRPPERPKRSRPRRDDRYDERPQPGPGLYLLAALGGLILLSGLTSIPRVLGKLAVEDGATVLGRMTFVGGQCLLGLALFVPLIRGFRRDRETTSRRDNGEDEDW